MRFRCDGGEYDTDRMMAYPTKNRALPFIYLSPDFAHVFVQMMDAAQGVSIRSAGPDEIRRLADAYQLPILLRALPPPSPVPLPTPPYRPSSPDSR